jgi:hypothetical protein
MRVAGSGSGNEGNEAMKDGGMIRDQFHGAGFSATRTRLQWITHQASVEAAWVWGWASSDFLGKSWKNPGKISSRSHRQGILRNSGIFASSDGIRRHQMASFTGAPIPPRDQCHVTQPRASINVSCSRAGHEMGGRGAGEPEEEGGRGQQRTGTRQGCQTKGGTGQGAKPKTGQSRTGRQRESIALKSQMKLLP